VANNDENPSSLDTKILRVLVVEDSRDDFELEVRALESAGLKINAVQVASREEFQKLTETSRYHVILSDDTLRGWTGMDVLDLLKQQCNDTPFILVCDAVGEERAVEYIKAGADDLVWKSRLGALPRAVNRAISDKATRDARKWAEACLRESEARFRALADSIASAVLVYQGTACRYANLTAQTLTGYSEEELLRLNSWDLVHPDSRSLVIEHGFSRVRGAQDSTRFEAKILTKQGEVREWDMTIGRIALQDRPAGLITALDITERKRAEATMEHSGLRDPLTGLLTGR
jgi:PAS domain S-box-containing protein